MTVELLRNAVRPYAWGSRTAIPELLGRPVPAPHPEAELWMGAHPGDPSHVVGPDGTERSLLEKAGCLPVRAEMVDYAALIRRRACRDPGRRAGPGPTSADARRASWLQRCFPERHPSMNIMVEVPRSPLVE